MNCVTMTKYMYNSEYILKSQNKINTTWEVVRIETGRLKNKPFIDNLFTSNTVLQINNCKQRLTNETVMYSNKN